MIDSALQLGDPVEHRSIVVAPLFPRHSPVASYLTLDEALPLGLHVRELSAAGSVPELRALNPADQDVLLYDGEELIGAKQNRILNVSVLLAAHSELAIPVSCVEQGRWAHNSDGFSAARHTVSPEIRARKEAALRFEPLARGLAQSEVWDAVAAKAARLGVDSPTGAQADTFTASAQELDSLRLAFPLQAGQAGALLALAGRAVCLDYVSRPDAFARLYPKLLDGYLLDALERLDRPAVLVEPLEGFVSALAGASTVRRPSAGRGEDLRLRGQRVAGCGLELDGELIQLSAFAANDDRAGEPHPGRIARPSRRQ